MNRILISFVLGFASAGTVCAQAPAAIDQTDALKRRGEMQRLLEQGKVPDFGGESVDVGPQSVLSLQPSREYFEASVDSQFFHTANMFLQEAGSGTHLTDARLWVNTIQASLAPTPYAVGPGLLAPRVGYRHQWFNYSVEDPGRYANGSRLLDFDFEAQTVFADLRYRVWGNWIFEAGLDWSRLLGHSPDFFTYNEIYKEIQPRWSVMRLIPITETRVLTIAYQGAYHATDTPTSSPREANDRADHSLLLAYSHALNRRWSLQPFYRLQYTHYTSSVQRNDWLNTVGLSFGYLATDNVSVRMFANYDLRDSDGASIANYRKLDAGLGLNFAIRF